MNPLDIKGKYLHCDLNIPYHGEEKLADRLKMAQDMGWDCVAITVKIKSGEDIPPPPVINNTFGFTKIFTRATVCKIHHENILNIFQR